MTPADKRTARDLLERAEKAAKGAVRLATSPAMLCLCEAIVLLVGAARTVVNGMETEERENVE